MPSPSYHFLMTAMNAYGPVNATMGFGEVLVEAGHKVTFTHLKKHKPAAIARGFGFIEFDEKFFSNADAIIELIDNNLEKFRQPPHLRYTNYTEEDKLKVGDANEWILLHKVHVEVLSRINIKEFDAIVQDWCDLTGALFQTGLPVINLHSSNPMALYKNAPPIGFGLSTSSEPKLWEDLKRSFYESNEYYINKMNKHLAEVGRPAVFSPLKFILPVTQVGFYHYPEQLDYTECGPVEPGYHRIDCHIRRAESPHFEIPDSLKDKPGSLIYFSLGSTASNDVQTMQMIIDALAKSPHRFIVSKGYRGDQIKLYDNMWGANYIDQIAVIQSVDLVITHGGNNTFTETLLYGKSIIVVGYFYDQVDNAQRVVDKNIGYRINPWDLDEDYLLDCIEKSLNDREMQKRILEISETMRNSGTAKKAVRMIEEVVQKHKMK